MKRLLSLVLMALPLLADLRSTAREINTIDLYVDAGQTGFGGDTYHFTAWTDPSSGGNFNGGRIYGSYNDGHGCAGGGNIAFLELTVLDWSNKANTHMNCVNSMSSYGSSQFQPAGWTEVGTAWKSFYPISWNGDIYWFINRQQISNPWRAHMSTVITSPDRGLHWCNPATFASHSGSPGCDATNYQANGDAPPNPSTGMMWGSEGVFTNPMARPVHVQFCQDETCSGMPFNADNFLYFVSTTGIGDKEYAACVAKSKAAIMDVAQWWYWKGGNGTCGDTNSWTHTIGSAVAVQSQYSSGADLFGYPSSVIYIPEAGQFLMTSFTADYTTTLLTSNYPWGPWKRIAVAPTTGQGGFPSANLAWLDRGCAGCNTNPGRWQLTYAASVYGHTSDASLYFHQIEIANGGPIGGGGLTMRGVLNIRESADGIGGRLIARGAIRAYDFADYSDLPSSIWTSAGVYVRELLGSGNCLAIGTSATGSMTWGSQSGTAGIFYQAGGIRLGGYSAHASSIGANCAGTGYLPLSGDPAFTVQMIIRPEDITGNGLGLFQFGDPANFGSHKTIMVKQNQAFAGGNHIDFMDISGKYVQTPVTWPAGANQYYLVTIVKTSGGGASIDASHIKVYIGNTLFTGSNVGSNDGLPINLPANLALMVGCAQNPMSNCDGGTMSQDAVPGVRSYFRV
jgi:hypothetical protein